MFNTRISIETVSVFSMPGGRRLARVLDWLVFLHNQLGIYGKNYDQNYKRLWSKCA